MQLRHKLTGCAVFFGLLVNSHYWLPVREVWYGKQVVALERMATPYAWEQLIESWDWVESYSLTWVYPAALKIDLVRKEAVAKTVDDRYVSTEGSFFHLGENKVDVPKFNVPDENVRQAVKLMDEIGSVKSVHEHPSGTIEVVLESKDKVLLAGYEKPKHYDEIMLNARKNKNKIFCDFRADEYANCH